MQDVLAIGTLIVVLIVPAIIVIGLVGQPQRRAENGLPSEPRPNPPAHGQSTDRQA